MAFDDGHVDRSDPSDSPSAKELASVREALRGLQFGSVNIIVQDGVVVQIDRTEKRRVRRSEGHGRTMS